MGSWKLHEFVLVEQLQPCVRNYICMCAKIHHLSINTHQLPNGPLSPSLSVTFCISKSSFTMLHHAPSIDSVTLSKASATIRSVSLL